MSNLPEAMENFIEHVKTVAKSNKVKVNLVNKPFVESGKIASSGFFSLKGSPSLSVATKKPIEEWSEILVHEYCHMMQHIEKRECWEKLKGPNDVRVWDLIDLWLDNKIELNPQQLDEYFSIIKEVEIDCEKSVIKAIEEFNLPIDISQYIKKANSYIIFYDLVKEFRTWYSPNKAPYMVPEVVKEMPDYFFSDYSMVPQQLSQTIERHCIKG